MKRASTEPPPDSDALFHFYHANLGPINIMISGDDGVINAIIDWGSAAYYPRFRITPKPVVSSVYWVDCATNEPKLWAELLGKALEVEGLKPSDKWLPWFMGRPY